MQIARAAFAAIAAMMVTFSPDHSAAVGMSVFSGFAFANGLVLLVASMAVYPAGRRWPAVVLGVASPSRALRAASRSSDDHRCSSSS